MYGNLRQPLSPPPAFYPYPSSFPPIPPGLTMTADATAQLELGYWPSYNVPYFPEVGVRGMRGCEQPRTSSSTLGPQAR